MKRYKLLKDLPTFKAGEEFYINSVGDLARDGDDVVAYTAGTLIKFSSILNDWFEEIDENVRWRAEEGRDYWFIDSFGHVSENKDYRTPVSNHYYRIGNHFKTEAEAEKYGEYLEALQVIKDDTKGFVPDWKNVLQGKYKGLYDHTSEKFDLISVNTFQSLGTIYFKNKEDIRESLKKHHKEWLIVLGVEERNEGK